MKFAQSMVLKRDFSVEQHPTSVEIQKMTPQERAEVKRDLAIGRPADYIAEEKRVDVEVVKRMAKIADLPVRTSPRHEMRIQARKAQDKVVVEKKAQDKRWAWFIGGVVVTGLILSWSE